MTTHSIQSVIAMLEKSRWTSICKLTDLEKGSPLAEEIISDANKYDFDAWNRLFQLGATRHDIMVHEDECEKKGIASFVTALKYDIVSKVFALLDARLKVFTKYSANIPGAIEEVAAQYISAELTPIWKELFSLNFTKAHAEQAGISGAEYDCYSAGKA